MFKTIEKFSTVKSIPRQYFKLILIFIVLFLFSTAYAGTTSINLPSQGPQTYLLVHNRLVAVGGMKLPSPILLPQGVAPLGKTVYVETGIASGMPRMSITIIFPLTSQDKIASWAKNIKNQFPLSRQVLIGTIKIDSYKGIPLTTAAESRTTFGAAAFMFLENGVMPSDLANRFGQQGLAAWKNKFVSGPQKQILSLAVILWFSK